MVHTHRHPPFLRNMETLLDNDVLRLHIIHLDILFSISEGKFHITVMSNFNHHSFALLPFTTATWQRRKADIDGKQMRRDCVRLISRHMNEWRFTLFNYNSI